MMIILIILIQGYLYSVQGSVVAYGYYGTNKLKRNYAVMQNVTWAEAFDICSNYFDSGRLFRKKNFVPHLMHDRCILKQNGWEYSDIWIGFMSSGYSPWLIAKHTSCTKAYNSLQPVLPPLTEQSAQCLVLNMSDTSYDDVYYSTSCSEHRAFLCQSQVNIGTTSYARYDDMIVMESLLKDVPIKQTDHNTTEYMCSSDLISITTNALAFASVYHGNNGTCVTFYLEKLIWYPMKVEMVNHSQAVSFVKSTGHEVEAVTNASYPVPGENTYSDNCFNYGVPTVPSTKKSTATRFNHSFSTDDSTHNTASSSSFSAENNKLSLEISSNLPTTLSSTETSTPRSEHSTTVDDKKVTTITETARKTISVIITDKSTSRTALIDSTSTASGFNYGVPSVSRTEKSMTTRYDHSYSTDNTDHYTTSFLSVFGSVSNKPSLEISSKSPTTVSSTEISTSDTEHPTTVDDKTVTEITDTARATIISVITTDKSTPVPAFIDSTSKASGIKSNTQTSLEVTSTSSSIYSLSNYNVIVHSQSQKSQDGASIVTRNTSSTMSFYKNSTTEASDLILNQSCICPCSSTNKSNEPFSLNNLRLNKKTLSSYRRSLTSATDQRFSVLLIGWSGVFVLVMAVLMIILPDVLTLIKVIRKRKFKFKVTGIS